MEFNSLRAKYEAVHHISSMMLTKDPYKRPDCKEILQNKGLWALGIECLDRVKEEPTIEDLKLNERSYIYKLAYSSEYFLLEYDPKKLMLKKNGRKWFCNII